MTTALRVNRTTGEILDNDPTTLPHHPAAGLFPLLQGEELQELADDIAEHGLNSPIWLYDDPEQGVVVLDGRNRLAACVIASVEPKTRYYLGDDPIGFSVSENLKRRHLNAGQRAAVADELLPLYEAEARRRNVGRPPKEPEADLPQVIEPPERAPQARDRAAKATGASGRAVGQYKRVKKEAPELAEKVRNGDMPLDRAERVLRDRAAEQRRIDQARRDAALTDPTRVDIRHGDFRHVLHDVTNVDAIITDPPYPAEFLPLLADLAAFANRVLSPDGVLAVLIGNAYLPDVYRLLDGGRPYRWTACYLTEGPGYVSHPRRVQSSWKPLIVYGGGPRFSDVIRSNGNDADAKSNHKWGQDYGAFHTIIERLTSKGQTVVDPFMGSGTTLLAAHALGRHTIGCDIEAESVTRAKERLDG